MRYGLLSDVHANLHALEAAVHALSADGVTQYVCAGDVVGYGAFPNECVDLLSELDVVMVAGNHDLMATGGLGLTGAPALVYETQAWTRQVLRADVHARLASLPTTAAVGSIVVTHGSLSDVTEYVRTSVQGRAQLTQLRQRWPDARYLVLGHTHRQRLVDRHGRREPGATASLSSGGEPYLVNPGSVGQSRQMELLPRVRFAVLDTTRRTVRFGAIHYDYASARRALLERGLPEANLHTRPVSVKTFAALGHAAVLRARRKLTSRSR